MYWTDQAGKRYEDHGNYRPLFSSVTIHIDYVQPYEVTFVKETLEASFVSHTPERLIGDKAYDSDPLGEALAAMGIEMIAPHRQNRKKPKTQDGSPLRRYKRRWTIEYFFLAAKFLLYCSSSRTIC